MVLPKAQTLEEIEGSMIPRPKVLTAEELERQLRGETIQARREIPPAGAPPVIPNGHPPPGNFSVPPPNMNATPPRPMVISEIYLWI